MATLAANEPRAYELGELGQFGVVAGDIIYEGSAVGLVKSTGYAQPLTTSDKFVGFCIEKADNSAAGAAAGDVDVKVRRKGSIQLTVTGATITDVGQPVYASDDNAFTLMPVATTTSNVFIGYVQRFVSSGVAVVAFDVDNYEDPWGDSPREEVGSSKTLDVEDNGKVFFVDTDAQTITLPATATPIFCSIVNAGSYGTVAVNVSPNASDKVQGPDLPGTDNKDHINTKATAQRGDYIKLSNAGDANGAVILEQRGIWATEA